MKYSIKSTEFLQLCPDVAIRVTSEGVFLVKSSNGSLYKISEEFKDILIRINNKHYNEVEKILNKHNIEYLLSEGILCITHKPSNTPHVTVSPHPRLDSVLFEISSMCNLACKHCYNALYLRKEQLLNKDKIYRIIDVLDKLGARRIQISGGEPLLRDDLVEILRYIKNKRIYIDVIVTNGTLINEEILTNLKGLVDTFFVSLDGFEKEHDEFRGLKGAWKATIKGINLALKNGYNVILNTMVHKKNYYYMEDFYEFAKYKLNVNGIRFGMPKIAGRFKVFYKDYWIEPTIYIDIMAKILRKYLKEADFKFRLEIGDMFRWSILSLGLVEHSLDSHTCSYNIRNMHIRPDGAITFCPSLGEQIYGNILIEGENVYSKLINIIENKPYFRIRNLPKCRKCIYYKICGGGCRANALMFKGSLYAEDPISCLAMKKIHEMIDLFPENFRNQFLKLIEKARGELYEND